MSRDAGNKKQQSSPNAIQQVTEALFLRIKGPGRETDHVYQSREVQEIWNFICVFPTRLSDRTTELYFEAFY